ncbi:hypothetical protein L0665_00995 [Methanogenium marinum]|uniref:Uncharacterized protein n=1 Tax=Methanogenium marinum TaxID=348610 RepID=A0A9Q4KMJ2_9EURY|nr:hypothetical protein [Methanogenium marinum]MDE4907203.1 hypothetical protein [Methanogenium marinum]
MVDSLINEYRIFSVVSLGGVNILVNDIRIGWKLIVCMVVLLSVCCVCGCTDESSAGDETATPAQTAAATVQSTPQASATGDVVHYTAMMEYLPTMTSNWIVGEKDGATMDFHGESWSMATAEYTLKSDDSVTAQVIIQDTKGIEGAGYSQMWTSQMTLETPEMKMYTGTAGGYPAYFIEDLEENGYTEFVYIDERFFVYVMVENGKPEYLTVFNNQIDFDGIAGLA